MVGMITKIYLITNIDGIKNKVYIGKTITDKREKQHRKKFGRDIDFTFIDEINSVDRKDWEPLESYWIEQFKQWGFSLVNKNRGGGGPEYHTKHTKKLISQRNLERDPEVFQRISNTLKNSAASKALGIRQAGASNVAKRPEVKAKIAKRVSDLWKNPEYVKNRKPEPIVKCPHFNLIGKNRIMKRWHFKNCKYLLT